MNRIVFVCTGNLCRSPMAEGILRERWRERHGDRGGITVSSMGIRGMKGMTATSFGIQVCQENGIDISGHRAREIVPEELRDADLILVMERSQKNFMHIFFKPVAERVFLLAEWPDSHPRDVNIKDPMNASIRVYRKVFQTISSHIDRIIPELELIY